MTDERAELLMSIAQSTKTLSESIWVIFVRDFFGIKAVTPYRSFRLKQLGKPETVQQIKADWQHDDVLIYLPAIKKSWWGKPMQLRLFKHFPWAVEPMLSNFEEKQMIQQHPDYQYWLNSQKERSASKVIKMLEDSGK